MVSSHSFQYLFSQPPPPFSLDHNDNDVGVSLDRPQRFDDDLIPFSDTPQISRFGPISRKILCPPSLPTQSQAIIEDETKPTSVVRHAKHMSRPVPAAASLFHQNGMFFTLFLPFKCPFFIKRHIIGGQAHQAQVETSFNSSLIL
jgi:hypothetical protein